MNVVAPFTLSTIVAEFTLSNDRAIYTRNAPHRIGEIKSVITVVEVKTEVAILTMCCAINIFAILIVETEFVGNGDLLHECKKLREKGT